MLINTIKLLLIASALQVASSWASVIDNELSNTSGANDTISTAQNLGVVSGVNPLTVFGWIDSNNPNDVDFFKFSVADPSLTLYFDIDFAEDLAQTADNGLDLDSVLWIFDLTGQLIAWNDDSDFFITGAGNQGTDPGSDVFADRDAFIGGLNLLQGDYFAAVSNIQNYANAWFDPGITLTSLANLAGEGSGDVISDAPRDATFQAITDPGINVCIDTSDPNYPTFQCTGQYQLQIRTAFDEIQEPVPEPALFALVGIGLMGLFVRRRIFPA